MFDVNTGPIDCKCNDCNCIFGTKIIERQNMFNYTFFGMINVP